jgi:hypothetical protein
MKIEEYFNEGTPFKSMKPALQQGDFVGCLYYKFKNKNMNAREKAKEIYCNYADALNIRDLQTTANPFVKQCALILVDERLQELNFTHIGYGKDIMEGYQKTKVKYWNDVKSELQSL